jgi:hypothetical protein
MRRLVPSTVAFIVLFLASLATTVAGQSLGEVAERTSKERKGKGGKVYTNDDLTAEHSAAPPPASAATAPAASPAPTMDPAQRWRRDAKARRDAITRAEAKVAAIQARLDAMRLDLNPTNVGDPNRLQTLEADKATAQAELDAAKDELAKARQAQEDLEEEARKSGVPPGWLREP